MRGLLLTLRTDLAPGTERGRLVRSALGTSLLRGGSVVLAFLASLIYARALGPHGYGLYAYVLAWSAVLSIPASLGLPQYLVREGARHPESHAWLLHWADRRVLVSGMAGGLIMACAALIPAAAGARWLFVIAAPLPLLSNLAAIRQSLIQARGDVVRSQWAQQLLAPALMLIAVLALWLGRGSLTPRELTALLAATALAPLLVNHWLLRASPHGGGERAAPASLRPALTFMWLGTLYLINSRTDLIMLGALRGAQQAGIYAVASRAADLVIFFLIAGNAVIAPRMAQLHQGGEHRQLQRLLTAASTRVTLITLPIVAVFLLFAAPLLNAFYGPAFAGGATALQILTLGQFFSVLAGPTAMLLIMTGHERLSAAGVGTSVVANIALNAILIPRYGMQGAAIATACSMVIWNLILWYWIRHRLGLRPTPLGV